MNAYYDSRTILIRLLSTYDLETEVAKYTGTYRMEVPLD